MHRTRPSLLSTDLPTMDVLKRPQQPKPMRQSRENNRNMQNLMAAEVDIKLSRIPLLGNLTSLRSVSDQAPIGPFKRNESYLPESHKSQPPVN